MAKPLLNTARLEIDASVRLAVATYEVRSEGLEGHELICRIVTPVSVVGQPEVGRKRNAEVGPTKRMNDSLSPSYIQLTQHSRIWHLSPMP